MSEYLDWYKSHCGHSEMKRLAASEIEQLTVQLAKANEQVKWLEKRNNEYAMCIISISDRVDIQDYLENNPTYENAKIQLNKFAIEQKIKGYYDSCIESGMNEGQSSILADIYSEQLRKCA